MNELTTYRRTQEITPAQRNTPAQLFSVETTDFTAATVYIAFMGHFNKKGETLRGYWNKINQFRAWLLYSNIVRPVHDDIIEYQDWLQSEHNAIALERDEKTRKIKEPARWVYRYDSTGQPLKTVCRAATVTQYMQVVKRLFRWIIKKGYEDTDIVDDLDTPKITGEEHKRERLKATEVLTVERSIAEKAQDRAQAAQEAPKDTAGRIQRTTEQGKRLFAMYLLAVNAGLRTVEISRANIKDLVTKDGKSWLRVWGKGHAEADTKKAIAPEVAAAIREYLNSRTDKRNGSSPLFVSTGNRSGGKRILPTTISTMLKSALKDAGIDDERYTAHSLRHSAGCAALAVTDNNIYKTQAYMRHKDPKTTEIYLHESDKEQEEAERMAQDVYNYYHAGENGSEEADTRTALERIADRLTAGKLEKLLQIAEAMA